MEMPIDYIKSLQNISYYIYPFPTGKLIIFGDARSIKLVLFGFGKDIFRMITNQFDNSISDEMERAVEFLDRYMLGEKGMLPTLDLSPFTDKEKKVLNELIKIPFRKTISYNRLSERAGIPNGARFVGNTMSKNLFPIFIPCHRVVRSSGAIGGFSAGQSVKRYLLEHEKCVFTK